MVSRASCPPQIALQLGVSADTNADPAARKAAARRRITPMQCPHSSSPEVTESGARAAGLAIL
jgi:hypothetical protein